MIFVSDQGTSASIYKCIKRRKDKLSIICEHGYVIYNPIVMSGVTTNNECSYNPGDCTGLTHEMIAAKNNCYWKSSCDISIGTKIPITYSNDVNCIGTNANYWSITSVSCESKGITYTLNYIDLV